MRVEGLRVALGRQAQSGESQGWNWEVHGYQGRILKEHKGTKDKGPKGGTCNLADKLGAAQRGGE